MVEELIRAREALGVISPDLPREDWVRVAMAAHAAGLTLEEFDTWSSTGATYDARAVRDTWRSIKPGKGIGPGTLFRLAGEHGWKAPRPQPAGNPPRIARPERHQVEPKPADGLAQVWERLTPATYAHPYIEAKRAAGVPLADLRVVPDGDALRIAGESMAGALAVPCRRPDSSLASLQLIAPPDTSARLKAKGKPNKLNLPGCSLEGWHLVGQLQPGGVVYLVEGIGQAWAAWQATGRAAVVAFGWGRVRAVAELLRKQDKAARLVLLPDRGKEPDAAKIGTELGCEWVELPPELPQNADVADLAQRDGIEAVAELLERTRKAEPPAPRFRLLTRDDLAALPPMAWRVRGVLPAHGLAAMYGPPGSGKSFLVLDMAASIAGGLDWFGHRVKAAPVLYAALEGEAGLRSRVLAWEIHKGRRLPDGMHLMAQPFDLLKPQDVADLAEVLPPGGVLIVDTLNRASPAADENSSEDMGRVIAAAKTLQAACNGLVLLVHHSGKDSTKGLRGHSSLLAALDAAAEVTRDDDRRTWAVAKAKDGRDGAAHPFKLEVVEVEHDDEGEPVTSCVVVPDQSAEQVRRVKLPQGGNQRVAWDALGPALKDGRLGVEGVPHGRPAIELTQAVRVVAAALPVEPDRKTERARQAVTGLVSRGLLGCRDEWLWCA